MPANILLCCLGGSLDVVKVLDFGLVGRSQQLESGTKGSIQDTPAFMAPEQALRNSVDGRADFYALGCVGFWLLTGRTPLRADAPRALLYAHIHTPVPEVAPNCLNPVPAVLADLIMALLAKDPGARPRDAHVVVTDLAAVPLTTTERWNAAQEQAWWGTQPAKPASDRATALGPVSTLLVMRSFAISAAHSVRPGRGAPSLPSR
jgi:serine/threonine protein kinase